MTRTKFGIAIHGGAGTIRKSTMSASKEAKYSNALSKALDKGYQILLKGGSALDAVESAVTYLEDCTLFNAGKGSVFTANGKNEMDASIMDGRNLDAGAVAMVRTIKNPVKLARFVMEKSEHVFLAGKGAEDFGKKLGFLKMDPSYFFVQHRFKQLELAKKNNEIILDHVDKKFGTVGAVALDSHGNLAAATSTGGMTNKKFGRIGDSPMIGSGTYANNDTCAVSCTGSGEYFIRANAAFHVSALMAYAHKNLNDATEDVVYKILKDLGGDGGLIAIDKQGSISMPFNTEGMYRASRISGQEAYIGIYEK
ncbi:MAG: isoaspartyl peptidase/L-asparaginase [Saprospiraceae bacterium]